MVCNRKIYELKDIIVMRVAFVVLLIVLGVVYCFDKLNAHNNHYSNYTKRREEYSDDGNCNLSVSDVCDSLFGICVSEGCGNVCLETGYCVTQYNSSNELVFGLCPYFPKNLSWCAHKGGAMLSNYFAYPAELSLTEMTDYTCGSYNRQGVLCSECKPGYGPAVYAFSSQCAKCDGSGISRWTLYLFLVFFPITVFYAVVIIFNIRAAVPPFIAFILMCQTYCMIDQVYVPLKMKLNTANSLFIVIQIVRTLCGFWNLDFFRYILPSFCVSDRLSYPQAINLEYIHVVYPLFLILVTFVCIELHARNCSMLIIIWKPFHKCFTRVRRSWDPRASIVNAFSTFLLLNFSKLVTIATYYLVDTELTIINGHTLAVNTQITLYLDPMINRYSK